MNPTTVPIPKPEMLRAWESRDPDYDGLFVFGVRSTGIYCRPSCPSRPGRNQLEFFQRPADAIEAGYRPCKRCRPELAHGAPPEWVAALMERVAADPDRRISAAHLRASGLAPERARRWFQQNYGMTFTAWCRSQRLARAHARLHRGAPIDDVVFDHGYASHSGFRDAFARVFGAPPAAARDAGCLRVTFLETPLGRMVAAASEHAVRHLVFAEPEGLQPLSEELRRRHAMPVVPGRNTLLDRLEAELSAYFEGRLSSFTVPDQALGTPFQRRVWSALRQVPPGTTSSYETIANRVGAPSAVRAVARANACNPLYLLIPCHRIIAKNGELSGYGGGVWRKRWLLRLEQGALLPRPPSATLENHATEPDTPSATLSP